MDLTGCYLVRVGDLLPGAVMASGHVVTDTQTGGRRYGNSVAVTFENGSKGTVGRNNRVWIRSNG